MNEEISRVMREAEEAARGGGDRVLDTLASRIGAHADAAAVFGDAVERDGVTVIPVAKVRWGFGGGAGSGADTTSGALDSGEGAGGGGGVLASPLGFIEIRNGVATFHRIKDPVANVPLIVAAAFVTWVALRGIRKIIRG
ncbi:MAG: sporulation protein [Dehalococcoidia bacterium]|nr:sporulation protein [Dehalococcoidia bacterium]